MSTIRYVSAPLHVAFGQVSANPDEFKREYDVLSAADDDSVSEWLRLAKARGETSESDQVLLTLVVQLHKKIDELSAYIRGEKTNLLSLMEHCGIAGIGHEHLMLQEEIFQENMQYYGRIEMPFFPKRAVPLYFRAINTKEAKIELMHERDLKDWSAYVVARERIMIREMRASKDGL